MGCLNVVHIKLSQGEFINCVASDKTGLCGKRLSGASNQQNIYFV